MPNLITRGATWHGGKLQVAGGRSVTFTRVPDIEIALTATATMNKYELPNSEGIATEVQSYDWVITTDELVYGSDVLTPRTGDQITETLNGETVTWEVLDLDEMRPAVEWFDVEGLLLLVHTKRVA